MSSAPSVARAPRAPRAPRSVLPLLASLGLSIVALAACTSGSASGPSTGGTGSTPTTGKTSADCTSPGSNGIATYSFGGPCGITGPTLTGSVQIVAHVLVDPQRQLSFQVVGGNSGNNGNGGGLQLYGSYDQCSCRPETTDSGPNYASYRSCDPSQQYGNTPDCTTAFDNYVQGTVNAPDDGTVTLQLMDGTTVLEQFSFEVAAAKTVDTKVVSGPSTSPALTPDASGVYQVRLSDQTVQLTPHLLAADGRVLFVGGGRSVLSATFSDSKVLASDPMAPSGEVGIRLTGVGDATVTLTGGDKLTQVLKFHVSS